MCLGDRIHLVDGGDFQLAALGWLDPFGILRHLAIVEIETGDRQFDFGCFGFSSSDSARKLLCLINISEPTRLRCTTDAGLCLKKKKLY